MHDGVLQVLALMQRRGAERGADDADLAALGRLAGEQESRLRLLIREQDAVAPLPAGTADLGQALVMLSRPGVEVVTPGTPVELSGHTVAELVATVGACLDNVVTHVGPDAPAWVYVEETADAVLVTVRDAGGGIPDERLADAVSDGRLGISQSIRGRLADLGGTATLTTGPGGSEWELSVARRRSAAS